MVVAYCVPTKSAEAPTDVRSLRGEASGKLKVVGNPGLAVWRGGLDQWMDEALYADTLVATCGHAALCGKPVQDGADSDPSFTFFYARDLGVCKKDGVLGVLLMEGYPVIKWLLFVSVPEVGASRSTDEYLKWVVVVMKHGWTLGVYAVCAGVITNLVFARYMYPVWSALMRKIRVRQYYDAQSDIRKRSARFKAKEFLPQKY